MMTEDTIQAPDQALAQAATQKVDDLIFICGRLSALLTKEGIALERQQPDGIEALLEEKELLCRAYESRGKAILNNVEELSLVDPDMCTQLFALVKDVEQQIANNTRLLAIHIEVNRKFFDILAAAAREQAPKSGSYSNNGVLEEGHKPAPKNISLSIDQSL